MAHENLPPQNESYNQPRYRSEEALGSGSPEQLSAPVEAEVAGTSRAKAALEVTNLVKVFGQQAAVDGVNLTVPRGSFYGLVGRNGAGKTTTLSMATGLLKPTAGRVEMGGSGRLGRAAGRQTEGRGATRRRPALR